MGGLTVERISRWYTGEMGTHPLDPQRVAYHQEIAIHIGENIIIAERSLILGWACHISNVAVWIHVWAGTSGDD